MKFSALITVASAIAAATAAPVDISPAPANELQERANNGANCRYKRPGAYNEFRVTIWGPWAQDNTWGRGLLDNLRGQCGVISEWQFYYTGGGTGVATFRGTIFCDAKRVQDAIWLASGPTNAVVTCTFDL
ncbi:hypothetical protein TWF281_002281 [Arthrobotrys megalospora]